MKDGRQNLGRRFTQGVQVIKSIVLIIFVGSIIFSGLGNHYRDAKRKDIINKLEKFRGSRVITLVHREETVGFFGIPVKRFIKEEDAEAILRAIRDIPNDTPIDLIVHTPGGMLLPAFQIAKALKDHKGKVTVFIPHYAMSGGTLIALAADQIVMDKNAVLGPVDPQFVSGQQTMPAVSILTIPNYKDWNDIDDKTIVMIDQARKSIRQVKEMVGYLLSCALKKGTCKRGDPQKIIARLVGGQVTHDYPIFYEEAKQLGLPVSSDMPDLVYRLMDLYPQPSRSVVAYGSRQNRF